MSDVFHGTLFRTSAMKSNFKLFFFFNKLLTFHVPRDSFPCDFGVLLSPVLFRI